ncbi:uncharacterized protein LOC135845041 [Planococcus citri]|uniref:uncharacterized protein LOC135845041 n=1 Tax=Planococcus citri TaxID=170843 RepID=UPI0031FA4904
MDTDDGLGFLRDRPFSCLEPRLSLQNLAATQFAFSLSIKKFHDQTRYLNYILPKAGRLHKYPVFSCRETLAVPSSIADIIDERIKIIVEELDMWEKTFWNAAAREKNVDICVEDLDNVICKPDGTICFQNFVNIFLVKTNLDPMIKFRMACFFCLEDHVRGIWPSIAERQCWFEPLSLVQYWKNISNSVPVDETFIANQLSVSRYDRNWAAFDYFWSKMTEESQTREAIKILLKVCDYDSMKRVLIRLNQSQVQEVCRRFGFNIFTRFIAEEERYEDAIKAWTCMRHFLPSVEFVEIVRKVWKMVFNPSELGIPSIGKLNALLLELWSSAPGSLKTSIPRPALFAELDDQIRSFQHYDLEFMFELLSDNSYSMRKEIWMDNWRKLVIRAKPCDLERLMKLCFETDEEINLAKEDIAASLDNMGDYFSAFINKGMYSELKEFLFFFVENRRRLENLTKEIIFSNIDHFVSCSEEELTMCLSFIDDTFRNEQSAEKFINEFTSSPECVGWIYSKLDDCCFAEVVNVFIRFPTTMKNLQETKLEYLEYCQRNFASGKISGFLEQRFIEFVYWCRLGKEKISELKNSLIIDEIFEIILRNFRQEVLANRDRPNQEILSSFDQFLAWYFGNWQAAKIYKSNKTFNFNEWTVIKDALQQGPWEFVDVFLNWSFGEDVESAKRVRLAVIG